MKYRLRLETFEHKLTAREYSLLLLSERDQKLKEIAKKYSFTGAASTVKGSELAKMQVSNVSRALEGTVSGLQASAPSGQPGTDAEIRIRCLLYTSRCV